MIVPTMEKHLGLTDLVVKMLTKTAGLITAKATWMVTGSPIIGKFLSTVTGILTVIITARIVVTQFGIRPLEIYSLTLQANTRTETVMALEITIQTVFTETFVPLTGAALTVTETAVLIQTAMGQATHPTLEHPLSGTNLWVPICGPMMGRSGQTVTVMALETTVLSTQQTLTVSPTISL